MSCLSQSLGEHGQLATSGDLSLGQIRTESTINASNKAMNVGVSDDGKDSILRSHSF